MWSWTGAYYIWVIVLKDEIENNFFWYDEKTKKSLQWGLEHRVASLTFLGSWIDTTHMVSIFSDFSPTLVPIDKMWQSVISWNWLYLFETKVKVVLSNVALLSCSDLLWFSSSCFISSKLRTAPEKTWDPVNFSRLQQLIERSTMGN